MNIWMIIGVGLIFYFVCRNSTIWWQRLSAYIGIVLAAIYGLIAIVELVLFGDVVAP